MLLLLRLLLLLLVWLSYHAYASVIRILIMQMIMCCVLVRLLPAAWARHEPAAWAICAVTCCAVT